jgi:phosphatidylglycerophosphatase A
MNQSESINNKRVSLPNGFLINPVHFLALGFGSGYTPRLPGTAGTLIGVLIYYPLHSVSHWIYLGLLAALALIGIWICGKTAADLGVDDHSAIVWDEIIGYLVTMIMAPDGWMWMVLGFILFRLFDIWKPWPISWADRLTGGVGIMLDDIIAGIFGLVILQIIAYLL